MIEERSKEFPRPEARTAAGEGTAAASACPAEENAAGLVGRLVQGHRRMDISAHPAAVHCCNIGTA